MLLWIFAYKEQGTCKRDRPHLPTAPPKTHAGMPTPPIQRPIPKTNHPLPPLPPRKPLDQLNHQIPPAQKRIMARIAPSIPPRNTNPATRPPSPASPVATHCHSHKPDISIECRPNRTEAHPDRKPGSPEAAASRRREARFLGGEREVVGEAGVGVCGDG